MNTRVDRDSSSESSSEQEKKDSSDYGLRILGGSGSILSGSMVGKAISFGLNLVLTRGLGANLYGLYTLGLTVLRIAREIASLGVQNGIVRFGAPQYEGKEPAKLKGTFLAGGGLGLISGVLVGVLLFATAPWLADQVFENADLSRVIRVFACGLPFYVFTYLASRMARALGNMRVDVLLSSILQPALFLLLVSGLFLAQMDFVFVLYAFLASTILAAATSFYAIYRLLPEAVSHLAPTFQLRRLVRFSIPILGVTLANTGLAYTDRIMIGMFASSGAVGIYQAAATMATQMRFALSSINASFSPVISDLYQRGKTKALAQLYADTVRWVLIATVPLGVVLIAFAPQIMSIFGADFREGALLLQILVVSYLIITGVGSVGYMLQMSDHQDAVFVINTLMAVSNIFLNWILIRHYGAMGAAVATGGIQVVGNLAQIIALHHFIEIHPFRWGLWKPLAAAGVASVIGWGSHALLAAPALWIVGVPAVLLGYIATLFAFGLHPRDRSIVETIWTRVQEVYRAS